MAAIALAGLVTQGVAQSDYYTTLTFSTLAGAAGQAGAADGQGSVARFSGPRGVSSNAIDGTVYVADTDSHTIRAISNQGAVTTLAGSAGSAGATDGTGGAARFSSPCGIAVNSEYSANAYVADSGNDTIRVVTPTGVVTTIAGTPGIAGSADGTGNAALFNDPSAVALDHLGNLYVADTGNHTVRKIDPAGTVTTLAGTPGVAGASDGAGPSALFSSPRGIAVDYAGNVYVADTGNHTIRMITTANSVTTLAGKAGISGSTDGAGSSARFSSPMGVAIDVFGNVFVADTGNDTLRAFSAQPGPVVVITIGGITGTAGSADGSGSSALFSGPGSISVDSRGDVYIADTGNNTVRNVAAWPQQMTAQAQPASQVVLVGGTPSFTVEPNGGFNNPSIQWQLNGVNIPGATNNTLLIDGAQLSDSGVYTAVLTLGSLTAVSNPVDLTVRDPALLSLNYLATGIAGGPNGIATDSGEDIFITAGNGVEKIGSTGEPVLVAGSLAVAGSADGVGGAAQFNAPGGIATDGAGNIYVADSGNNSIRKVTPLGVVTTLAGLMRGNADGVGAAAQFNNPTAVAVDASGNVYVVDAGNNELREVAPDGTTLTLLASSEIVASNGGADGPFSITGVAVDALGRPNIVVSNGSGLPNSGPQVVLERVTEVGTYVGYTENGGGNYPASMGALAIDAMGNAYWTFNSQVWLLAPNYVQYPTIVGPLSPDTTDAVTLATGPAGTVYVADPKNQCVFFFSAFGGFNYAPPPAPPPPTPYSPITYPAASATGGPTWLTGNGDSNSPATPPVSTSLQGGGANGPSGPSTTAQNGGTSGLATSTPPAAANRLANISSRALVGTEANIEIAGFVVAGPPGSTEQVLIRGIGPTLTQFGVSGALANPILTLFDSAGNRIATNAGWGSSLNAPQIAAAIQATGAFALPPGSADSALLLGLAPGAYTAPVTGLNGSTGVALAEVYETNDGAPRLINISTRAFVGTGSSVEIAGIDLTGTKPATVLIRAVGPTLGQLGVSGALAQPSLSVVDSSGNTVASNIGWSSSSNASQIASTAQTVGAFALASGSADSALLLTLPPGAYTAIVSGVGGTSGVALVEAYEAP